MIRRVVMVAPVLAAFASPATLATAQPLEPGVVSPPPIAGGPMAEADAGPPEDHEVAAGSASAPPDVVSLDSDRSGPPTCIYRDKGTAKAPPGAELGLAGADGPPGADIAEPTQVPLPRPPRLRTSLTQIVCD